MERELEDFGIKGGVFVTQAVVDFVDVFGADAFANGTTEALASVAVKADKGTGETKSDEGTVVKALGIWALRER